jgi:hypothetical protein
VYENRRKNPKYSAELAWINLDLKENRIESLIRLQLPLRKMHKNIQKKANMRMAECRSWLADMDQYCS